MVTAEAKKPLSRRNRVSEEREKIHSHQILSISSMRSSTPPPFSNARDPMNSDVASSLPNVIEFL